MKIILLIGEMGSGKSHVGKQLASELGYRFIEGDDLASPEMTAAIKGFKIITAEMVDDLVKSIAEEVFHERSAKGVVISQALYHERHRRMLIKAWKIDDHEVEVRWVKAPLIQHVKQLWSRPRGFRWIVYWLLSKPFFQKPAEGTLVLYNRRTHGQGRVHRLADRSLGGR